MAVDTSCIQRRAVRFTCGAEAIADAEALAGAEREGRLVCKGNWTLGQALGHLAGWIGYCFEGYPLTAPPELAARARARLPTALREGLMAGFRIPGVEGGTAAIEVISTETGLSRFRAGWERLGAGVPGFAHPFFGAMSHEEWVLLHLRHAELHLGCFEAAD